MINDKKEENIIVGIDFAINSTGICIKFNDEYKYYGLIRKDYKLNKKQKEIVNKFNQPINGIQTIWIDEHKTSKIYYEREDLNIKDAIYLNNLILDLIKQNIKKTYNNIYIIIEGLSFNSKSNRLVEISGYQFILRSKLHEVGYNLYIFSPKTIKQIAGSGSLDKEGIMQSFINQNEKQDQINTFLNINSTKILQHPFEDMIDAFWAIKTFENKILNK
jgi:hypothetical protein